MVINAADFQSLYFVLPGDSAEKRPESFAQWRRDERAAFLGAKHAVEIATDVGHAAIQSFRLDLCNPKFSPGE